MPQPTIQLTDSQQSFDQVIDFLEAHGNLTLGPRWRTDKDGLHTYMSQPIDVALVKTHFSADSSVNMGQEFGTIINRQGWMEITHRPGLQYDPKRAGHGDAYFYPANHFDRLEPKTVRINPGTGEILLGKANVRPGSRLADFPQLRGEVVAGTLRITLPWNFHNLPWFAAVRETRSLFRTAIKHINLGACPYPDGILVDDVHREEEIAFAHQQFLIEQLGEPHDRGAVVTHYKQSPIHVLCAYKYRWGSVSVCWDPKNMRSGSIDVDYA
ncbi:MAG: hypothetical protein ACT4NL_11565 [Pseudomarimonas sp.]